MSMAVGLARAEGIALVVTLMASVVLLGIAGVLVPLASTEVMIAANYRRAVEGLHAAEAALEWTVGELTPSPVWRAALVDGARSRLWAGTPELRLADGTRVPLDDETAVLRGDGAGPGGAGRGLDWSLFAHGPLADLVPLPEGYGEWHVAVWLAPAPGAAGRDPEDAGGTIAVHAAALDPGRGHRAVQAELVRVVPPLPVPGGATEYVQLIAWRIVR
ncbi:MAG: hypothetical protein OXF93_00230 [Acidobacteria bacterium]|nr:hypothetical protein [Acidobacteriota bacterium]